VATADGYYLETLFYSSLCVIGGILILLQLLSIRFAPRGRLVFIKRVFIVSSSLCVFINCVRAPDLYGFNDILRPPGLTLFLHGDILPIACIASHSRL
jgi:hypothetical protein